MTTTPASPTAGAGRSRSIALLRHIAKLFVSLLLTFLGLTIVTFCIGRLIPIDPVLAVVGDRVFDFAFSTIVFQHIPSYEVIESYVREVHRLLRPGALFKFQVQGDATLTTSPDDTWLGVPFSDEAAVAMAERCGFEPRHRHGAGQQYFWLWYFKRA